MIATRLACPPGQAFDFELHQALRHGQPFRFLKLLNAQDKWPFGFSLLLVPFVWAGSDTFAAATLLSAALFTLVPLLLLITFIDFDHFFIPDEVSLPGVLIGLGLAALPHGIGLANAAPSMSIPATGPPTRRSATSCSTTAERRWPLSSTSV